ncbi:hypothetical protein HMPREF9120_00026 [Neisseria sp. oral taxon 020 str. F0370]|nr:hypothetical protein HMPREF9120_00026 [Neisseria sp. oral taxon 020 str. F0370]
MSQNKKSTLLPPLARRGRFSTALEMPRKPAPYYPCCLWLATLYLFVLTHYSFQTACLQQNTLSRNIRAV